MYTQSIPEVVALKATHSPSSNEQTTSHLVCYCNFGHHLVLRYFLSFLLCVRHSFPLAFLLLYNKKSPSLLKKEKQTNKKKESGSCGDMKRTFFYQINVNCKGPQTYRVFSHDVTAAILVFQNNKKGSHVGVPRQSCGS